MTAEAPPYPVSAPAAGAPAPPAVSAKRRWRAPVGLIIPAVLFAAWGLATDVGHVFKPNQLPPIHQVWAALLELLGDGDYTRHLVASLVRVGIGFSLGAGGALVVGVLVGLSRGFERLLDPTLQALRSVPSSVCRAPPWSGACFCPRRGPSR